MLNPLRFREATARSLKDVISTPPEKQWAGMPKYCAAVWAQIWENWLLRELCVQIKFRYTSRLISRLDWMYSVKGNKTALRASGTVCLQMTFTAAVSSGKKLILVILGIPHGFIVTPKYSCLSCFQAHLNLLYILWMCWFHYVNNLELFFSRWDRLKTLANHTAVL